MKQSNQQGFSIIEGVVVLLMIFAVIGAAVFVKNKQRNPDIRPNTPTASSEDIANPPKFIQHDIVDLKNIFSISKYRSAEGHDFSDGSETCRSMKHYYNQQFDAAVGEAAGRNNGIPPQPNGTTDVTIYAPVDGTISRIEAERMPIGEQLYITPDKAKKYTIRLFHVFKSSGIAQGTHVSAGQKIGVISKGVSMDISVETGNRYVSYFNVMSDSVFATYKERGAKGREDFILTKDYRDNHPVPCNQDRGGNQQFTYPDGYDHANDIVQLSGYIDPAAQGHYQTNTQKR